MIVDKPYTINVTYGPERFDITVDSPDYNQPINWFCASCKVTNQKKIDKLINQARAIQRRGLLERNAVTYQLPYPEELKGGQDE